MLSREELAAQLAQDLERFAQTHAHPGHRAMLALALPLMAWGAIAMVWTIPVPPMIGRPGFWAVMALVAVFSVYWKRSHRIGAAMFVTLLLLCLLTHLLYQAWLPSLLLQAGLGACVLGIAGLLLGWRLETRPWRWHDVLSDFSIGPAWWLDSLLHRLKA